MSYQLISKRVLPTCRQICQLRQGSKVPVVMAKRNFLPARRGPQSMDPFTEMQRSFESLFRDLERSFLAPSIYRLRLPLERALPMETVEDGQRLFKIEIDLPDFKPEDVNVTVKKGEVTVEAKSEITEGENKQLKQICYTYSLPEDADLDKVRSVLKTDGRLVIEAPLPQLEAPKENQEIPIKKIE